MMKAFVLATLLVAAPVAAAAQARFQSGPFAWTPVVALRDTGIDTNVFEEATDPKRDRIAIVTPRLDGRLELTRLTLLASGSLDLVYYDRNTSQRSVNHQASVRGTVPLTRVRPFFDVQSVDTRERPNSEIDLRARRRESRLTGGLQFQLTSRGTIELGAHTGGTKFRAGELFLGVDLATRLNRDTKGVTGRFQYEATPLTLFVVRADYSRDQFATPEYDADNLQLQGGFEFAPDAILKGRASVGYHKMGARGPRAIPFNGLTASVDIGYTLLGRTSVTGRFSRDTTYSFEQQPYYLMRLYGGEIRHNLVGPVDVSAHASTENVGYPGIRDRNLPAYTLLVKRYGGGVTVRAADRLSVTFNYELTDRTSDYAQARGFERKRVFTTITYGF